MVAIGVLIFVNPTAASDVTFTKVRATADPGVRTNAEAPCPQGREAIGIRSAPGKGLDPRRWRGGIWANDTDEKPNLEVYAICQREPTASGD